MSSASTITEIEYPESDGRPMGETDIHRLWMTRIYDLLSYRFRDTQTYIASDLLLYYIEGQPFYYVVPDVFVVKDCEPKLRRVFKTWEEGRVPNVVFEVTSRKTQSEDELWKPKKYAQMGVKELVLYDPTSDYLELPLQAYRLGEDSAIRIEADSTGALPCQELGLKLRLDRYGRLEIHDAETGSELLTEAEAEREVREAAEAQREVAEARRQAAEAQREIAEAKRETAEAAHQAAEAARQAVVAARQEAEAARREADVARQAAEARATAAEEELARLRKQLGQ